MKKVKIVFLLIQLSIFIGCVDSNKHSSNNDDKNQPIDNSNLSVDSQSTDPNLYNDIVKITQHLQGFEGISNINSLDASCGLLLSIDSDGNQIIVANYITKGESDGNYIFVNETFEVTQLKRKSIKDEGFGLETIRNIYDSYLFGEIKSLRANVEDSGMITDKLGNGKIWIYLDNENSQLYCSMIGQENTWLIQASINLSKKQFSYFQELFDNK